MKWFGYLLQPVAALVSYVVGRYFGAEVGVLAGGAVATYGARVLHTQDPPAK